MQNVYGYAGSKQIIFKDKIGITNISRISAPDDTVLVNNRNCVVSDISGQSGYTTISYIPNYYYVHITNNCFIGE